MSFVPSQQQQAFFNWILIGNGSAILEAVAGAGKTTTGLEGLKLMKGDVFVGAYSKNICEEMKVKVAKLNLPNVDVSTVHAAGLKMWKKIAKYVQVDSNKCRKIFDTIVDKDDHKYKTAVINLVSYAKQAAIGISTPTIDNDWYELIDHFNIDCQEKEELVIDLAKKVLSASINQDHKVIDFDDMIYAPLYHKVKPVKEVDWVVIDEAQDISHARKLLVLLMLKRGGRLVAIGDPAQSIFAFSGASSDSLDNIAKSVDAIRLPLTVSYRCPKKVVEEARKYVSHITSHESAIDGEVIDINVSELISTAKADDMIVSRFNRPLIDLVYKFIAEGIAARVEGKEISESMQTLVRRYKAKSFSVLLDKLEAYKDRETVKYRLKEKEGLAVAVEDKVSCIKTIVDRLQKIDPKCSDPVERICSEIKEIFGEDGNKKAVILTTIHKAKGREAANVFWLQTGPSKWAKQSWEKIQETNLLYVAITRAMKKLYKVTLDK
jgi:superfamily I DNA/RNA helicase